ncbi:MAG: hypothetical protein U9R48_09820 [Chloroflexota bacterium]|nr:hypothetical protein [Chloroflexota bacterium]
MMITVKISDQSDLHVPRSLSDKLSLSDEDQVEFARRGDVIILKKVSRPPHPRFLHELAGLVKSSHPKESVDVSTCMTPKGYEYLCDDKHS